MLYEKILVPIDGSESSLRALQEAARISKITGGKITAIFVCSELQGGSSFVIPKLSLGCNENVVFAKAKKVVDAAGITIDFLSLDGNVAEKILKVANEGSFGLIVMGARGL